MLKRSSLAQTLQPDETFHRNTCSPSFRFFFLPLTDVCWDDLNSGQSGITTSQPHGWTFSFTAPVSCSDGLVCCIPILSLLIGPSRLPTGFSRRRGSSSSRRQRRLLWMERDGTPAGSGRAWKSPRAPRSSENRRSGRLKGLNGETQLHSPETD